ncbi:MAG: lipid-A-disaccharide synthase [Brevinema sp.]
MDKFFIVAGEVSGDMFAARLMKAMKMRHPCRFSGFGGANMRKEGLESLFEDNTLMSAVGFVEAWRFILKQWKMLRSIVPYIRENNINHIILVDHEFFSLMAASRIRKALGPQVKIYFFIAPRVSMWGRKTAPWTAELCDAIFCYMQSDVDIYKKYNGNAFYYGNPLSGMLKSFVPDPDFYPKNNLSSQKNYVAIMPGSRRQEIKTLLPIFLQAAHRFHKDTGIEFLMTIAHKDLASLIAKEIARHKMEYIVHILNCSSLELMSHCRYGLVSAGTVTLESAMMGMYPIIAYKVTSYTFKTIKKAEGLGDDTLIGLPNVFLNQRVFPELLQWEVTPDRVFQELEAVHKMDPAMYSYTMSDVYTRLSDALGDTHCFEAVANYILEDSKGSVWRGF